MNKVNNHSIRNKHIGKQIPILLYHAMTGPPQVVDVLAVLDFQIPFFRPEPPALYPRSLPADDEGHERKLGRPRQLK